MGLRDPPIPRFNLNLLAGRWSTTLPADRGLYFARVAHAPSHPYVVWWDPPDWNDALRLVCQILPTPWEFFCVVTDEDGRPTRADDSRLWRST